MCQYIQCRQYSIPNVASAARTLYSSSQLKFTFVSEFCMVQIVDVQLHPIELHKFVYVNKLCNMALFKINNSI